MPYIFLSPSTQEKNLYLSGGTEEDYMNQVADAMEPYLTASGIRFDRNDRNLPTSAAIEMENSKPYDFIISVHSNAAPDRLKGQLMGTDVYYFPTSTRGKAMASDIANRFIAVYPDPQKVDIRESDFLGELSKTKPPAVLVEVAYHDNAQDEKWIKENIETIAKTIVLGVTDYFEIPFRVPEELIVY